VSYTYPDWVTALGALLQFTEVIVDPTTASPTSDVRINAALPRAAEYANERICREIDLLAASTTDATGTLAPNNRTLTIPTSKGVFVVIDQIALLIGGVRQPPLLPASRSFIDGAWPSEVAASAASVPLYWVPLDNLTALVAPSPGSALGVEVYGSIRPAPLSATNSPTFLSTFLPDLFFAASMVWMTGFQRDWSSQADDPKMALSWENTYLTLSKSASIEEARKNWQGPGWSSNAPTPLATPPQT
jgi:hypothetical protein